MSKKNIVNNELEQEQIDPISLEIMEFSDTAAAVQVLEQSPVKTLGEYNQALLKTVLRHSRWEINEKQAVMRVGRQVADLMPIAEITISIAFFAFVVTGKEFAVKYPRDIRNHL